MITQQSHVHQSPDHDLKEMRQIPTSAPFYLTLRSFTAHVLSHNICPTLPRNELSLHPALLPGPKAWDSKLDNVLQQLRQSRLQGLFQADILPTYRTRSRSKRRTVHAFPHH